MAAGSQSSQLAEGKAERRGQRAVQPCLGIRPTRLRRSLEELVALARSWGSLHSGLVGPRSLERDHPGEDRCAHACTIGKQEK